MKFQHRAIVLLALCFLLLVPAGSAADSCVTDDFSGTLANWTVSNSSGGFGDPRIVAGRLRLTDNSGNVATLARLNAVFPAAGNKITIVFDHYAYGSTTGADGIAVVLSDSAVAPIAGAYGGSLGYAQKTYPSVPVDIPGFAGGWLGVGIDEFGNFSAAAEGRVGGLGGRVMDSVSVRGSGAGVNNYRYQTGTGSLGAGIDSAALGPGDRYRIIVDHHNGVNAMVSVERDTTGTGTSYVMLTAVPIAFPYDAKVQPGQAAVPTAWSLSFTGSTGGSTNVHEIDNLSVCTPGGGMRIIRWREVVQ